MKNIVLGVLLLCSILCASSSLGSSVHSIVSSKISLDLSGTYSGQGYKDLTISGKLIGTVVDTFQAQNSKNCVTVKGDLHGVLCGSLLDTSAASSSDWEWVTVFDTVHIKGYFTQVLVHPDSTTDSVAHISYIQKGATLQGSMQFTDVHKVNFGSLPMIKLQNQYQLIKSVACSVDGDIDMFISGFPEYPSEGKIHVLGNVKGDFRGRLEHSKYTSWDNADSIDLKIDMPLLLSGVLIDSHTGDTINTIADSVLFEVHVFDLFLPEDITEYTEVTFDNKKIYGILEKESNMSKLYSGTLSGLSMKLVVDTLMAPEVIDSVLWNEKASEIWSDEELDSLFSEQEAWKTIKNNDGGEVLLLRSVRLHAADLVSPYSSFQVQQSFLFDQTSVIGPWFQVALLANKNQSILTGVMEHFYEPFFQLVTINGEKYKLYNVAPTERYLSIVSRGTVVPVVKTAPQDAFYTVALRGRSLQLQSGVQAPMTITLRDLRGRLVQKHSLTEGVEGATVEWGSHLAAGFYLLHIMQGEQQHQQRLYLP